MLDVKPLRLRAIKVQLNTGEVEILLASLTNPYEHFSEDFEQLYHQLWPIEEDYKAMKCWMEVEIFLAKQSFLSSKTSMPKYVPRTWCEYWLNRLNLKFKRGQKIL